MAFLVYSFELFVLDRKMNVLTLEMGHSVSTIGNSQVETVCFEDTMYTLDHLGNIHKRVFWAHQGIDCGLIKHKVKGLVLIGHLPHIHNSIRHPFITFILHALAHLLDDNCWYVVVGNVMIAILVHIFLDAAIAAANVENKAVLSFGEALIDVRLSWWMGTFSRL